ncbi:lysozyme inhibitor LprI family protein [Rhodobacter lacus]|uniref:Lysozyme inhibitor LprI family protein n=2 Tax=Rhodobacter lacus TaxID=1641972 RepID=A0ABW5A4U2_9RHOB
MTFFAPAGLRAQDLPAAATADIPAAVQDCFAEYNPRAEGPSCLGQAAQGCMGAGAETTANMIACIGAETAAWDGILNAEYKARKAEMGAPGLADTLQAAQRAWIAFRDAECALEIARWGDASLSGVVGANCLMEMTAARAADLRDKKADP